MRPLYVGIDLGTTNSTAAVFDGERVTLVRNAQGGPLTPSVVRIDARGNLTVGARARRFLDSDPDNTRGEFKRLMGTAETLPFPAASLAKKPEELAAEVLKALRADVEQQHGVSPTRAVISVPALFELPQSAATSEAARLAGFEKVELIQEPVASALAAGWAPDAAEAAGAWLVYDLGGGTFDVSLLETRDGLLRVVCHDGDNFLGGRDFDWALVDWVLDELARKEGVRVSRADPRFAGGIRKLKLAIEDAKIELTRAGRAEVTVPGAFDSDGRRIDVEVSIDRATLDALATPLVDRTITVCQRLLAAHGLSPAQLSRIVLVGGPTVMPALRARVKDALGAPFEAGLDPMTLVAEGAALYAATAGLDARPKTEAAAAGRRIWLQHPAMSSDLSPHVVGRLVAGGDGPEPAEVRVTREGWDSAWTPLDGEQAFVIAVELLARRSNLFRLEARTSGGAPAPVSPAAFSIVHGMTIGDPPLSRTIGVALADDSVCVYFERGVPLPAKRTFMHHTVESVARGESASLLRIPIVQGELERAHLCRLVGTLEIAGRGVTSSLPAGSLIELTLELDRGGHLAARALVPALGQVFEEVAQLLVPDATPEALEISARDLRTRVAEARAAAFRRGSTKAVAKLEQMESGLAEVARDVAAARGGDADAAQKARRTLLELDGVLEELEAEKRWPELEDEARSWLASASRWVSEYGTATEQKLLDEAAQAVDRARVAKQPVELQRQLRVVRNLNNAAFHRHPMAWQWLFEDAASRANEATDLPRAEALVRDGRKALERGDTTRLKPIVDELWRLLPADAQKRRLGHDSGLR